MGLLLWVRQSIQVELDKYHKVNTYTYLAGLQHYNIKNCSKQSVAQPLWCKVTDQSLRGSHCWACWMAQEEGDGLSKEKLFYGCHEYYSLNRMNHHPMNEINNISSTWRCFTRTSLTSPSVPNLELWATSSLSSVIVRYWQPNESLFHLCVLMLIIEYISRPPMTLHTTTLATIFWRSQ